MSLRRPTLERDLCIYIFSVSAAMVGVCLTVIGIVQIVISATRTDTWADELLALDAILFLVACLASYAAMRKRSLSHKEWIKRLADTAFVLALLLMVWISGFLTFAIVFPTHKSGVAAHQTDAKK